MGQSDLAVLNGTNPVDNNTFVTAAQSQYLNYSGNVIGVIGMGVNNNASYSTSAYGGYYEAYRMASTTGGAYGIEIDPVNYGSTVDIDPYQQAGNETIGLQVASGAELTSPNPATAAINIQNNHATFERGIVFGANAISGATGTTGTGIAIALGKGHELQWYGSAGVPTSSIVSLGATYAGGIGQQFLDNQVQWINSSGNPLLSAANNAGAVNYVLMGNATTGNYPSIQAYGSDANIALNLSGKGAGGVLVQGSASGSAPPVGYVGETPSSSVTSTSMTSGSTTNCASETLSAGNWLVWGNIQFNPATTTTTSNLYVGINTVSGSLPASGKMTSLTATFPAGASQILPTPLVPVNISSPTTVYLVGNATFGASTMTCTGTINAVRYH
jgi:hypothetical protein